ncbi:hypothetical protein GCM10020256_73830 [Streptomyces thermocoprophilus]
MRSAISCSGGLGGVRDGVGAEPACGVAPGGGRVDGEDAFGAEEAGGGDGGEPDGPGSHDSDGVAGAYPAVEDADLVGGGEDVGQQDGVPVAQRGGQRVHRQVGVGDADVLGLCAVDEVAEDPASAAAALAVHRLAAVGAPAAGRDAGDQHPVAGAYGPYVGAGLHDLADRLVSEDGAGADLGDVALEDVQIGSADGDGVDPDDRVGRLLDGRIRHVLPGGAARAVEHIALHDDPSLESGAGRRDRPRTLSLCGAAAAGLGPIGPGRAPTGADPGVGSGGRTKKPYGRSLRRPYRSPDARSFRRPYRSPHARSFRRPGRRVAGSRREPGKDLASTG